MVAAANTALSATADGNQKKPGFPGFIPPGANPQQVAAALAARPAPNVLAGTGLGMGDPMKQIAPIAPAVGGGLAPAFNSGTVGENARYNAIPQDNAQNAGRAAVGNVPAPVVPQQPKPASAGVDGIPTGGPTGWTGGTAQPAPKTAFGDLQSTIQNQVEKAVWGSTITPSPSTGLPSPQKPAATPALQNPLRVQEAKLGLSNPGTTQVAAAPVAPAVVPQRNAAGALTSLGAGTDVVGAGIKKYVVDGKTLYSNMGDDGPGGNLSLMNRGAPTAQNMAAMDALVNRSTAEGAQAVQRMQFNDQVAQAQAINARPNPEYTNPNDLRDPANIAARNRLMDMQMKSGESPQAYGVRVQAMAEAQRLAATQGNANADRGLKRDELTANQQIAQSKLGIDQQQLGLKQQQVGNELATGAQSRDAKGMEIAAAKQLQTLQAQLLDPKATDAQRLEVGKKIAALQGKTEKPDQWDSVVVNGGTDALGNKIGGSAALFNKTTGEYKAVGAPVSSGATAIGQKYEVGQTVVRGDGAKVRVLAVDESGKPTKFQPI